MSSFDKILEKGKKAATPSRTIDEVWKNNIAIVLHYIQRTNDMYKGKDKHHVSITPISCNICSRASFVIVLEEINKPDSILSFNLGNWKLIDSELSIYNCPKCKEIKI